MAIGSALVLLAVVWFMVLFVVLPLNLTTQGDVGEVVPGTMPGSPHNLNMKRKIKLTTIWARVIWAVICAVIISGAITVRDLDVMNRMGDPPAGETNE